MGSDLHSLLLSCSLQGSWYHEESIPRTVALKLEVAIAIYGHFCVYLSAECCGKTCFLPRKFYVLNKFVVVHPMKRRELLSLFHLFAGIDSFMTIIWLVIIMFLSFPRLTVSARKISAPPLYADSRWIGTGGPGGGDPILKSVPST